MSGSFEPDLGLLSSQKFYRLHPMPPRLIRRQQTGHLHDITVSRHDRSPCSASPEAKQVFLKALRGGSQTIRVYHRRIRRHCPSTCVSFSRNLPPNPSCSARRHFKRSVSARLPETPASALPRDYDFSIFTRKKRIDGLRCIHRSPVHPAPGRTKPEATATVQNLPQSTLLTRTHPSHLTRTRLKHHDRTPQNAESSKPGTKIAYKRSRTKTGCPMSGGFKPDVRSSP